MTKNNNTEIKEKKTTAVRNSFKTVSQLKSEYFKP